MVRYIISVQKIQTTVQSEYKSLYKKSAKWCIELIQSSDKILPLSKKFIDDLKALKESIMNYTNFKEEWFVFGNELPLGDDAIRRRKNNNCKLANVKQIRLHNFRHSCASFSKGADIKMVAEFLGHTKIDETLNTYAHMFTNKLKSIVNIIDGLDEVPQNNVVDKDNDDYEIEI